MRKRYSLIIQGHQRRWGFEVLADPEHLNDWLEDGIEIEEIVNTYPQWVVVLGLQRPWRFAQDVFQFKNPWRER